MSISRIFPSPEISTSVASKSVISKPLKSRSRETIAESEKFFRKLDNSVSSDSVNAQ